MKIKLQCGTCPQFNNPSPFSIELPITEELYYTFKCDKEHDNKCLIGNTRYGLLFESGLYAYIDGYNREAVSSCYVALERFYEHVINMFLLHDNEFPFDDVKSFKKTVYLSERMYGVFCTVYLMKFKKPLVPFDNKQFLNEIGVKFPSFENSPVNFRNKIIHDGYLPSQEETLNYAKAVGKFIMRITNEIVGLQPQVFLDFALQTIEYKRSQGLDQYGSDVSNVILPTYIGNIMIFHQHEYDLEKHLEFIKSEKEKEKKNKES